jgi:hypothetical protein
MRWIPIGISSLGLLAGIALIVLGVRACDARDPATVDLGGASYEVVTHHAGQTVYTDLQRGGHVEHQIVSSIDMCDAPLLAAFDVDDDGTTDLYFRHCRGEGYIARRSGALASVRLSRTPGGWWARQVLSGGWRLVVYGVAVLLGALVCGAIGGAMLRPRTSSPRRGSRRSRR